VFTRLLESNQKRQRRLGGAVASTIVHTLLIALGVKATQLAAKPAPKTDPIPKILYTFKREQPRSQDSRPPSASRSISSTEYVAPPKITPPTIMIFDSDVIPPPGHTSPALPDDFDPTPVSIAPSRTGPPNGGTREPLAESVVDKPIVAIPGTTTPRYPSSLQTAGLEGDVRTQFIVDTLGRVERGSVRVLDSTHELFSSAVRDALARARFKPAEAGGHVVRQLAEQTFTFRITK
jgi:protein TonB